jgi:hypothetical protein
MNEQIKELAEQAEIKFEAHLQHFGIDTAVITPADLKKFAELIVRECIEVVKQDMYSGMGDHSDYSLGGDHALQMAIGGIKEHFGVE